MGIAVGIVLEIAVEIAAWVLNRDAGVGAVDSAVNSVDSAVSGCRLSVDPSVCSVRGVSVSVSLRVFGPSVGIAAVYGCQIAAWVSNRGAGVGAVSLEQWIDGCLSI